MLGLASLSTLVKAEQVVLTIADQRFEQPLEFNVQLPKSYSQKQNKRYVLMFDFHPNAKSYLTGMHDWMSLNGEWPWLETIIVTPAYGNPVARLFDATGKTTPLLDFFETQLVPEIDKQYRTNGFRIFSGFRVNGSVVLSSLVNKPNLFNAHIVISPELTPERVNILKGYGKKLAKLNDKPRYLLFTHGETIKEDHQQQRYSQLKEEISANAPASLQWQYQNYKAHYFMSLPVLSTAYGIEQIFDEIHNGLAPESKIARQGVDAIVAHYKRLSTEKFGFEVSPKSSINALGFHLLETSPEQAIKVFNQALALYPQDAYAYHHLAKAYAQSNKLAKAIELQEKAVSLAANMLTWHKKRQASYLAELRALAQAL
jgi:tetratricopeptide (TPR) repeat protein